MTDELKPVRWGCGGEAIAIQDWHRYNEPAQYCVYCKECEIETADYATEAEAIEAWNRAMGSAEKSSTVERTAKVENISDYRLPINDYCFIKKGDCGNCGFTATEGDKYCRECGARLEWK